MNKCGSKSKFVLGMALVVGCGLFIAENMIAEDKPATTPAAKTAAENVLFSDDFNTDGTLSEWSAMNRVSEQDVTAGHALMVNDFELIKKTDGEGEGVNPMTSLVYSLSDYTGNITCECKLDEFAAGTNCLFEISFGSGAGNMLVLDRWSGGGKNQALKFQVIADSKQKLIKQVPYLKDSVILKAQYTAKTGELRGFYKETPEGEYKEFPGSPYVLDVFKEGPYSIVFLSYNYSKGSPASVKLDWVKITSPADK